MTLRDVKESRFLDIPSKLKFDRWKVIYKLSRVHIWHAKLFQLSKRLRNDQNSFKGLSNDKNWPNLDKKDVI